MFLLTAPWRRAPLLLARTPGVLVACVVAMAALAVAAASGVLFLASAGTGALRDLAGRECPEAARPGVTDDPGPARLNTPSQAPTRLAGVDATVRRALAARALPRPDLVAMTTTAVSADPTDVVTLFSRVGARAHVAVVDSRAGPGVWVPQSFAAQRRLGVGSHLDLGSGTSVVSGVYRDIAPSAFDAAYSLPRYWCSWSDEIVPTILNRPPPFLLADRPALVAAASPVAATWYVGTDLTRSTVPQLTGALDRTARTVDALRPDDTFWARSDLDFLLGKAGRERAGLEGATVPINVAGTVATGLLVAAAGAFWGLRRQREIRLLTTRGVGRPGIAIKAMLELGPGLAAGVLLGWVAALALVSRLGPASEFEPGAASAALAHAAIAGVGGLLAVGALGACAVPSDSPRRRRRWLRWIPWEIGLLALSVLTYREVRANGSVRIVGATVRVNPLVLTFPLLALTGGVVLLARASSSGLRRASGTRDRLPPAAYLALRRLTGTPAVALGTVIGVALPLGILVYSAALSGATASSVTRKYETNVGAPHAFGTLAEPGSTPRLGAAGTVVSLFQTDPTIDGGQQVRVIGVDPRTFPIFAFGGAALRPDLGRLAGPGAGTAVLLVNAPAGTAATRLDVRGLRIPIRVVGTRADFPGERDPYEPLLVVDRSDLPRHFPLNTDRREEVWTDDAHRDRMVHALIADGVTPNYEVSPTTFLNSTGLRPVTWIFGYLRSLAYLTGLIAVTALAFAFTARARRRALSYHLARRMGLSRAAHRRSLLIEVGGLVAMSWVIGIGLSLGAVALVYRYTDPYPAFPPPPRLPVPVATIGGSAILAVLVVVLTAESLQRVLDRVRPGELLRIE